MRAQTRTRHASLTLCHGFRHFELRYRFPAESTSLVAEAGSFVLARLRVSVVSHCRYCSCAGRALRRRPAIHVPTPGRGPSVQRRNVHMYLKLQMK